MVKKWEKYEINGEKKLRKMVVWRRPPVWEGGYFPRGEVPLWFLGRAPTSPGPELCASHYMHYALCTICTMDCALSAFYYVVCTMHYALCTMHYALCTMHYALHMHYVLCTMHYVTYPDKPRPRTHFPTMQRTDMNCIPDNCRWRRGEREWLLRVREREGNWKSPFPKLGNGKGIKKSIPKFREWEGNEKIPFPKFGNGKGMKKIHSQNSGTGREWKNPFPKFGKGNQRPPFLGMTGNGNGNIILFIFGIFSSWVYPENFFIGFVPQNLFLTPLHVYSQKKFGTKTQCKIFHDGTSRGCHLNSVKPMGFCYPTFMGLPWNIYH